jgi:hypothetical protein
MGISWDTEARVTEGITDVTDVIIADREFFTWRYAEGSA